ncbi:MAG: hypothetical protein ABIR46_00785 [Candidatus Saccharimonadales bacterium]
MRINFLSEDDVIPGLPMVYHYKGLVTIVTDQKYPAYEVIFTDFPSPSMQTAIRALLGNGLYDQVFIDGEVKYRLDEEKFEYLPAPSEADFQHILRAIQDDFRSSSA